MYEIYLIVLNCGCDCGYATNFYIAIKCRKIWSMRLQLCFSVIALKIFVLQMQLCTKYQYLTMFFRLANEYIFFLFGNDWSLLQRHLYTWEGNMMRLTLNSWATKEGLIPCKQTCLQVMKGVENKGIASGLIQQSIFIHMESFGTNTK